MAARPLGIDVSSYQGTITWPSVAGAGISFAWAKATEGTGYQDAYFVGNQNNGKAQIWAVTLKQQLTSIAELDGGRWPDRWTDYDKD